MLFSSDGYRIAVMPLFTGSASEQAEQKGKAEATSQAEAKTEVKPKGKAKRTGKAKPKKVVAETEPTEAELAEIEADQPITEEEKEAVAVA
jgi:hypothetical protein